jgi:predicted nucleic acid-binding Zn ribbon protein
MTAADTRPGAVCVVCSAPFDARSRAHRLTCSGRCRSRLYRIRRRKAIWDGAWLAARRAVIGA